MKAYPPARDKIEKTGNKDKRVKNIEHGTLNFENEELTGIEDRDLFDNKWVAASKPKALGMVNAGAEGINHFE